MSKPVLNAREYLIQLRKEWTNDFISVKAWAEHHSLTQEQASQLLTVAIQVSDSKHPDE